MKFFLVRDRKFEDACTLIKCYTRQHINRALNVQARGEKERRKVILVNELAREISDRSELCSQLLNVFFAGRDTPAVALTNIFFLLARHPQVWTKCRAEVEGLQIEDLNFEKLKSLRYIQHVINEGKIMRPCSTERQLNQGSDAPAPTSGCTVTKLYLPLHSPKRRWSRRNTICIRPTRGHDCHQLLYFAPRPRYLRS
jgi:hypothetical protein